MLHLTHEGTGSNFMNLMPRPSRTSAWGFPWFRFRAKPVRQPVLQALRDRNAQFTRSKNRLHAASIPSVQT